MLINCVSDILSECTLTCQMKFFGDFDFYNQISGECEATAVCVQGYILSEDVNKCLSVLDGSMYVPPAPTVAKTCSGLQQLNTQTNECECFPGYVRNTVGVCQSPPAPASIPQDVKITTVVLFVMYFLFTSMIVALLIM